MVPVDQALLPVDTLRTAEVETAPERCLESLWEAESVCLLGQSYVGKASLSRSLLIEFLKSRASLVVPGYVVLCRLNYSPYSFVATSEILQQHLARRWVITDCTYFSSSNLD